jgi:hypothetical protein
MKRVLADLAFLTLLAACGGGSGTANDAAIADAVEVPGPATITVFATLGTPAVGAHVVFGNPDGTVASEMTTDASGMATGTITPRGMITAAVQQGAGLWMATFYDVRPADNLQVTLIPVAFLVPRPATPSVTLPSIGSATSYQFSVGCGTVTGVTPGTATSYNLADACIDPNRKANILERGNDATGAAVGYDFLKGQAVSGSGPTATVSFPLPWTGTGVLAVDLVPDGTPFGASFNQMFQPMVGNIAYDVQSFSQGFPQQHRYYAPQFGFADSLLHVTWVGVATADAGSMAAGLTHVERDLPPNSQQSMVRVDFGNALPRLQGVTVNASDPQRPLVSWDVDGTLIGADGGTVDMVWADMTVDGDGAPGLNIHFWTAFLPGVRSVRMPQLPASMATFRPVAASLPQVRYVQFLQSTAEGSYTAFKRDHDKLAGLAYTFPRSLPGGAFVTVSTCLQTGRFCQCAPTDATCP